jgi:hypothetical protein
MEFIPFEMDFFTDWRPLLAIRIDERRIAFCIEGQAIIG